MPRSTELALFGRWIAQPTAGFQDGIRLDASGNPLTDAAKVTERLDPATEIMEYICNENEKDLKHMPNK